MLPDALLAAVRDALDRAGDGTPLLSTNPVAGGCISSAVHLRTSRKSYFLKWDPRPLPGLFRCEAAGLSLLRETHTVRIPELVGFADGQGSSPGYLLLEWIEPGRADHELTYKALGKDIARLHKSAGPAYGLGAHNYVGSSVQKGGWDSDWAQFYRERRLAPQIETAARAGLLPATLRVQLETITSNLDRWLGGIERQPALVHGDLWSGNVLCGPAGQPFLIDPAVYYADREVEIAYTHLFGSFPAEFYEAYQVEWPLPDGWQKRVPLYNLYHLLNHLNIFGRSYLGHVEDAARRCLGEGV